jgi:starvation-inducible DNA-binding protein
MNTTNQLNSLLASYQVHYQNLRGIHWNIKGVHFFELHVKFEELYLDAQTRIDETAYWQATKFITKTCEGEIDR